MAANGKTPTRRWVPLDEGVAQPAATDTPTGGQDDYQRFVLQNRVAPPAPAPTPAQAPASGGLRLGSAPATEDAMGADLGSAIMSVAEPPAPGIIDQAEAIKRQTAGVTPVAGLDPQAFAEIKQSLGAMPRDQRLRLVNAPGWKGRAAQAAIEQLDAEQSGMDALRLGQLSPTLEGRAGYFAGQGAPSDVARSKAIGEMVSGGVSEPVRNLRDGGQLAIYDAAARQEGAQMQRSSIASRAGFAASEGMKAGTLGVASAALRAAGDNETAQALEISARRSKIRIESANELTAMRARAQDEGTVYGTDAFWENQAIGGISSAAQNAPQMAAGMALTALTKNPAAGARLSMTLMTSQAFGDEYVSGRMAHMTPGQAASRAGIMAGFEYLGERFGLIPQVMKSVRGKATDVPLEELPQFLERFVGGLEKRGVLSPGAANLARGQLGEQFGEQLTTAGQYWIDGTPLGMDQPVSLSGYLEAARDTAIQTLIATGALQGAHRTITAATGRRDEPGQQPGGTTSQQASQAKADAMAKWQGAFAPAAAQPAAVEAQASAQPAAQATAAASPAPAAVAQAPAMAAAPVATQADDAQDGSQEVPEVPQGSLASAAAAALDERANQAATSNANDLPEPTDAQKEAGNYAKGHVRMHGLDIAIENPRGSTRRGTSPEGVQWESTMAHHYGYIKGSLGNDGDQVDTFIGQNPDSTRVFVVDQVNPKTGRFDEHKVVMGADSIDQAREIYQANYEKGWQGLGAITELPMPAFKSWVKDGAKRKPLGDITANQAQSDLNAALSDIGGILGTSPSNEQIAPQTPAAPTTAQAPQEAADQGGAAAPGAGAQGTGVPGAGGAATAQAARLKSKKGREQFNLDPERDTLLQALAKMGGMRRDSVAGEFGLKPEELKHTVSTGKLKAYPFRKTGGMDMDQAITALAEAGYFTGMPEDEHRNAFERAIYDELGGSPLLTPHGQMRQASEAYNDQQQQAAQDSQEQVAQAQAEDDAERQAIMDEAGLSEVELANHRTELVEAEAAAQSLADGMRAMGFTEQEIADEIARQVEPDARGEGSRAQDPEVANRQAQAPPAPGDAAPRPAGRAGRDAGGAQPDAGRRQGQERGPERGQPERLTYKLRADGTLAVTGDSTAIKKQLTDAGIPAGSVMKSATGVVVGKTQAAKARQAIDAQGTQDSATILTSQTADDLKAKAEREDAATKAAAAKKAAEQERLRRDAQAKDEKSRADATVDDFQLGQSADQQLSGMADMFGQQADSGAARSDEAGVSRPTPAATTPKTVNAQAGDSDEVRQAKADAMKALGDLADIFGKGTRLNMVPEQEQKLLPVLTRLFDAAFRLGYLKFKDAARFALDQIRTALGDDVANQITLEHLQGGYIGMSGRYKGQGADSVMAVAGVSSLSDITDNAPKEGNADVPSGNTNLERDRQDAGAADAPVEGDLQSTGFDQRTGTADTPAGAGRGRSSDDPGVPAGGAAAGRASGDRALPGAERPDGPEQFPARGADGQRSDDPGIAGVQPETIPAKQVEAAAVDGIRGGSQRVAQRQAQGVKVTPGDLGNIRDSLPFLLPEQQEDVHKGEVRFAKPDGYGILLTNGTGTGKTYSGLGMVKRFERQGKTNILILVPDAKIMEDWVASGKDLLLDITPLADTKDAGQGITITTYANFGENDAVVGRTWDFVLSDEAHSLMQSAEGGDTKALTKLRAITLHPGGYLERYSALNRDDIAERKRLGDEIAANDELISNPDTMDAMVAALRAENQVLQKKHDALNAKLREAQDAQRDFVAANQLEKRPRAGFLSATPFAYEKTVDWANGYLFDYKNGYPYNETSLGYNDPTPYEYFFITHFGYRKRVGKLTEPDAKVNRGLMQRQFNGFLRKSGSLSGRQLKVNADYDRRFVLVDSAVGNAIDRAIEWVDERAKQQAKAIKDDPNAVNGYAVMRGMLQDALYGKTGHLVRRYLLEAIKAKEVVQHVRDHMALGRKVVVFHDFKKGGAFNPFNFAPKPPIPVQALLQMSSEESKRAQLQVHAYNAAAKHFASEFPDLAGDKLLADLISPIQRFNREFPGVLLINGDEKKSDLLARYKRFNDDAEGPSVALVQSAKNKGWSGHDTTGKHQRTLFNLGLPTQPTMTIQQEGRIYRTGQVSDAMFRYLNTGTNWERWAFAETIASRASAAENLANGEQSRALRDSFISAFEESDKFPAGHEGEGKGGKERDSLAYEASTEFDRAKAFYWGTQKKTSKTKAQEGTDYFATPEPVGLKMAKWADVRPGEDALEPSAGHGAIARWFDDMANRTAVEPSSALGSRLGLVFDGKIIRGTFEDLNVVNKFDGVAMNPPFGTAGRTAIDHVAKAATHLRDFGRIVALIPEGPATDKKFDAWFYGEATRPTRPLGQIDHGTGPQDVHLDDTIKATRGRSGALREILGDVVRVRVDGESRLQSIPIADVTGINPTGKRTETYKPAESLALVGEVKLPSVAFERAGTAVRTRILVIDKLPDGVSHQASTKRADLSQVNDITELFDRIEDIEMPRRLKPEAEEAPPAPSDERKAAKAEKAAATKDGAAQAADAGLQVIEHITKGGTGKKLRGVVTQLSQAEAKEIDPYTFKKDGGWFIRAEHIPKLLAREGGDAPQFSLADGADPLTPAFKAWFGDSKVVDEGGKPLVMYHGTSASQDGDAFTMFDTYASNYGLMGMGGYFTADPAVASSYTTKGRGDTPTVYPVFLSIKNPLDMEAKADVAQWTQQFPDAEGYAEGDTNEAWYRAAEEAMTDQELPKWEGAEAMQGGLMAMGFDGITHMGGGRIKSDGVRHRVFIAFDPEQIKSAIGNRGTFDTASSDIRLSASGGIGARVGILGIGEAPSVTPRPVPAAISRVDLDKVIDVNLKGWRGLGLDRIIAVDHWTALPQEILQDTKQRGFHAGAIEGVVFRGRVYLVRSNLRDVEHARRVLFHEALGHLGVNAALSGKPTATLNALWEKLNGLAGVAKLAQKYEVGDGTAWDRLQPYVQGTQEDVTARRTKIIDELIAFLVQANDTSALTQFKGYMADLKGAIVALLRRLDLNGLADRLDRAGAELDVLQLVRDARQAIQRGKTRDGAAFTFVNRAQAPAFSGSREGGKFSLDNEGLSQARAFLEGEPIASLTGNEFAKDGTPLTVKVPQWYVANGVDKIDVQGIGTVVLDERAVKASLSHGIGRAKSAAFAAVPAVLRNGMVIHEEAMRGNADVGKVFHIAAPIEIEGQPHVAVVLVKSDQNGRRMYVHEVVLRERLQGDAFKTEALSTPSGDARNGASPGAIRSVLQDIFSVKPAQGSQFSVGAAPAGFNLPEFGRTGRFIEAVQNRYNRWKQTIEAVRAQGGAVSEVNDFYSAEERYWGIVGAQLDDFKTEVQDFVKAVQADGLELSDVALYAYAKHAAERNARIAQINDKFPDGGSGMTDKEASDILAKAQADGVAPALDRHAAELGRWTQGTRDLMLRHGLLSQDEHDSWSKGYQHYVPLRGQPGQADTRKGTGSGFDIRGRESFRAMGRRSQAGNIIEHIMQDRARALIRAGKNDVLRRFARFVLDNPDPNLWQVNAVQRKRALVDSPMGEKVVEWDELNREHENTVALKDGGQTIYITVHDEQLLKQLKNLHDEAKLPFIVEALHWANRLLSRMYTSLNPVFTVLNGARDAAAGTINMIGVAGARGAGKLVANLPGAYREAFRGEVRGKPSAMYEEYRRTGGKTGFMDFKEIEGYSKELAQIAQESVTWRTALDAPGAKAKAAAGYRKARGLARKLLDRIEDVNGAVENATRFAAFKAAREAGKSVAEASSIAKNITVNFNRRGTMTPVLGSFFLFFNPAVQGTARMVQALGSRQVQIAMGSGMAALFGLALMNAAMGGDDDDDGLTFWDKIPDEVKDRNLVIMLPPGSEEGEAVPGSKHGRYIKIPMPYGYNTFAVLASTMADMLRHQMNPVHGVSATQGAARVFKSFVGAWIPVSDVAPSFDNAKGVAMIGVPDALDPLVEPLLNMNSFGRQMYPDGFGQDKAPDSEKVFGAQKNSFAHRAARSINAATGGSQYHEGFISLTPATINNVIRGYGGGVASFVTSIADTMATRGIARDKTEWWRAPFVKQVYGEVNELQDQALAYDRLGEIEKSAEPMRRALKAGDRQAAQEIVDDVGQVAKLGPVAKAAREQLTRIRKHEIRVMDSTTLTDAEKNASLRQWDGERQKVYDRVNRAWAQAIQEDAAQ